MIEIMNSINTTELKSIFGMSYCIQNNSNTLNDNYNNILSTRGMLQSKIYFFLDSAGDNSILKLSTNDLDLLAFSTYSAGEPQYRNLPKYLNYYSYDELSLFKVLKKLSIDKDSLTEEDIQILNQFLKNRSRVESLIANAQKGSISLDKYTIELLLDLSSKRNLTVGHTIRLYENLCHELNLGTYTTNPKLEYRIIV